MRHSAPPLQGSRGSLSLAASSERRKSRSKEGGGGSERQRETGQGRETDENLGQACGGLQGFAFLHYLENKMAGGEGGMENMKGTVSLKYLQGKMATATTSITTQIITPPPKRALGEKQVFSVLNRVSAISRRQPLHIRSVWNMNTHNSNKSPLPPTLSTARERGTERIFMSRPSAARIHLHKEEILVHSVYLFCVEKSRAINHEEIHSTLFHFTLLSTTLYRVSEWIFNIMPQNALVFYHMLGLYQSDNTWEFWEILSTEENSFKI